LTGTLRDSIRNFSLQLNRVEADLMNAHAALGKQARYNAAIQERDGHIKIEVHRTTASD
jgi:hypothetical protein